MRKRTRWLVGLSACAVVAVAAAVWSSARAVGINRNGYDRIREGMALEEVSALLGKPPGDYRTREWSGERVESDVVYWTERGGLVFDGYNWFSDDGVIFVGFSKDGRAVGKHFHALHRDYFGWLRKLFGF
jgi:hypothetical protein